MRINFAHIHEQGIDFAVFDADSRDRTSTGRSATLARLTMAARAEGLKIDKAALAFAEFGRPTFFGTPDLVRFLSNNGVPRWTHWLDLN
jgi:hypothetical protein